MIALFLVLAALQADAPPDDSTIVVTGRPFGPCGAPFAPVHIAASGEPFRTNGTSDPMRHWFDGADANHDGRVTPAEFAADARRFFRTLDTDHDGTLDPQEVARYEYEVAPEVRLYRPGGFRRPVGGHDKRQAKHDARDRADYTAPYGAGVYASLNIPEPVAAADLDIDRAVTAAEFDRVVAGRFAPLDPGGVGTLAYDTLPRSPAQAAIDACLAKERQK